MHLTAEPSPRGHRTGRRRSTALDAPNPTATALHELGTFRAASGTCRSSRPSGTSSETSALASPSRALTAEVDKRLYGSGIVDRCDRGELDVAGIRSVLRDQLGLDCDDLELARSWAPAFTPDDQVLAVINSVRRV